MIRNDKENIIYQGIAFLVEGYEQRIIIETRKLAQQHPRSAKLHLKALQLCQNILIAKSRPKRNCENLHSPEQGNK